MARRSQPLSFASLSLLAVALTTLLVPTAARAAGGAHVDADLDLGAPLDGRSFAVGVNGRVGWRFDVGLVWLEPEAGGGYTTFLGSSVADSSPDLGAEHVSRVLGGVRLGGSGLVSRVIEPALFGHAGYGWHASTLKGPAFDVGFALDVNAVRYLRFGVQGAYNVVMLPSSSFLDATPSPAFRWLSYGVHAGVSF